MFICGGSRPKHSSTELFSILLNAHLLPSPAVFHPSLLPQHVQDSFKLLYSGKLSRVKTFANFEVLLTKVFTAKSGGVTFFGSTSEHIREIFFRKNLTLHQSVKVSRYMVFQLWRLQVSN